MNRKFHPYHIITLSPWPLYTALAIWSFTRITVVSFFTKSMLFTYLTILTLMIISFLWWRDVVRETLSQGFHHGEVLEGLKLGIILFISSEVFFFVRFFWAYFHSRISPCIEIGQVWPPMSVESFNPINVPLLNTLILLSSGVTVTWRHHCILINDHIISNFSLCLTWILGLYFTALQGLEYWQACFCISDSCYGSTFYIATGFHGIHVLIGTSFLFICWFRNYFYQINIDHLLGFEIAAWYWHFVDVVWLILYSSIYWWGA